MISGEIWEEYGIQSLIPAVGDLVLIMHEPPMRQRIGRNHRYISQFVRSETKPLGHIHEPDHHVLVIALGVIPHHPAAHDDGDGEKQRIEVQ